jgi:hypothetical protein
MDGYQVSAEMLQQHTTNIARIMSQLDAVKDAAAAQTIPEEAFGVACREIGIVGWLVTPLHDRGVRSVTNALGKAEEIRKVLADVGRSYDQTNLEHAQAFAAEENELR